MKNLTTEDLENLINEHLNDCEGYAEVCKLKQTEAGKQRIAERIMQLIEQDGITSIEACLTQIESELLMDV